MKSNVFFRINNKKTKKTVTLTPETKVKITNRNSGSCLVNSKHAHVHTCIRTKTEKGELISHLKVWGRGAKQVGPATRNQFAIMQTHTHVVVVFSFHRATVHHKQN